MIQNSLIVAICITILLITSIFFILRRDKKDNPVLVEKYTADDITKVGRMRKHNEAIVQNPMMKKPTPVQIVGPGSLVNVDKMDAYITTKMEQKKYKLGTKGENNSQYVRTIPYKRNNKNRISVLIPSNVNHI